MYQGAGKRLFETSFHDAFAYREEKETRPLLQFQADSKREEASFETRNETENSVVIPEQERCP